MKIWTALIISIVITITPTVNAQQPSLTGAKPSLLKIPSLKLEAPIEALGRQDMLHVPPDGQSVFWYKDGVNPGGKGSAVIAGHFDDYEGPAVFYNLRDLKRGDMVYVIDEHHHIIMFKVVKINAYLREKTSLQHVFQVGGDAFLTLVTCGGYYNKKEKTHTHRLVVKAKRVGTYHNYVPIAERVQ